MILCEIADNESLGYAKDYIHDTFSPESITLAVRGRSSDLFPSCGLPTFLSGSDQKIARSLLETYSYGHSSGFSPDSLFIR